MYDVTKVVRGDQLYAGKANTIYATNYPYLLEMESTDRISAGNGEKRDIVEGKGIVNNTISSILFELFERYGVPTHYVGPGTNEHSKIVRKANMIPLEVIGRFIAAGSFCKRHPDIESGTVFEHMLFEVCYKDDDLGDPFISRREAIEEYKACSDVDFDAIKDYTYIIGDVAAKFFDEFELELVDFKVEFGLDAKTGELILCDEFSPDTCRLWDAEGKSYDKDVFRNGWGDVAQTYKQLLDKVQGNN